MLSPGTVARPTTSTSPKKSYPESVKCAHLRRLRLPLQGKALTEQRYLDQSENSELAVVRITEFGSRDDITEDLVPSDDPVTLFEAAKKELRRWVVGGVWALMALAMLLSFVLVLLRPSLAEFAGQFLQLVVGGLIGLAGSIVGFLVGRDKM